MAKEIESEFKHVIRIIWSIITFPFIPFLILFGKKKPSDLLNPLKYIWNFFWDAKFTAWLIAANLVLFIIAGIINMLNPVLFEQIFVIYPTDIFKIFSLSFLSIIGAGFMHGSIAHLIGNMLFLFVLGRVVESKIGTKNTAIVYFTAMIISHIGSSILLLSLGQGGVGSVGASGAIAGLAAAAMLLAPFSSTYILLGIPIPIFIVGWGSLLADISGVGAQITGQTNIGHLAHLAGFFAIIPTMFFLMKGEDKKKFYRGVLINVGIVVAALVVWFFTMRQ